VQDPVESKTDEQKGAIIVAVEAEALQDIGCENDFNILPRQRVDVGIADYPVIIIPKELVVEVERVNNKPY